MKNDNVLSMLGLAKRGGNIVSGEFSVENAIRDGSAYLVVIAKDASDKTKKKFSDKCSFYNVPIAFYADKETLGKSIGCEIRTSAAVRDEGLAKSLIGKLDL